MKKEFPEVFFSEVKGLRHLHLGTQDWIQGSMRMRKPFDIELEYVQTMMAWMLFMSPDSYSHRHCMQLGLGAAAITKFCHKKLQMRTTAIEINPSVVSMCHAWFELPQEDELLQIIIEDAQKTIHDKQLEKTVDALCIDIYDDDACAPVLDSLELYAQCKKLLTHDGIMTVNLFGRNHSFNDSLKNIAQGFGVTLNTTQQQIWQFTPTLEGNTIVLAMASPITTRWDVLQERAEFIQNEWHLPAKKWLKGFKPAELITLHKK